MAWLYAALVLIAAALAFFLGTLVIDRYAKARIDGWIGVFVGAAFVLIYAFEPERELFVLAIGLTCFVAGVLALAGSGRLKRAGRQS